MTLWHQERKPAAFPKAGNHCLQAPVWDSSNAGVMQEVQLAVGWDLPAQVQAVAVGLPVLHLVSAHISWASSLIDSEQCFQQRCITL